VLSLGAICLADFVKVISVGVILLVGFAKFKLVDYIVV
jgi:hypothetical protein